MAYQKPVAGDTFESEFDSVAFMSKKQPSYPPSNQSMTGSQTSNFSSNYH
jgi:hypothetical protein